MYEDIRGEIFQILRNSESLVRKYTTNAMDEK